MNGVIGMANLLLSSNLAPEQRDYAQTIAQCCDSLLTIINDILDLSKIEAGRLELEALEFNLREMVELTVDLQRESARAKNLNLTVDVDENVPPTVCGDPTRLRQVLLNFVTNAVKFTERGQVDVRVSCHEHHDSGATMKFSVRDSGIGIAPDVQKQLFQPFVQADSSTTRRYGGTGLGLAISKRIIELMGGSIGVDSELGAGAVFWFEVSLATSTTPVAPVPAAPIVSAHSPDLGVTAPILVAEDNPVNQKVIALMLRNLGYSYRIVQNGREALDLLQREAFSLVLMDEHMPEMDGITATRQIRAAEASGALQRNEAIPIVATTADAMPGTRERCLAAGMNDYLSKPIRVAALSQILADFLAPAPTA
jgi:CheY-like chemotaxis protein